MPKTWAKCLLFWIAVLQGNMLDASQFIDGFIQGFVGLLGGFIVFQTIKRERKKFSDNRNVSCFTLNVFQIK